MKKSLLNFVLVIFILVACSSNQNISPTQTLQPTLTITPIPPTYTASPTITPSSTPELPVGLKTPIPVVSLEISGENVKNLVEIARYYGNLTYLARLTKDQSRLFIRTQTSLDIFDYKINEFILHIDLLALRADWDLSLQINDNGKWVLVDGIWLLNTETGKTKEDLVNVYELVGFKKHGNPLALSALSPDGKKLVVAEYYQNGRFYIIDTETNEIIYKSISGSSPVFSPDSSMIATTLANQIIIWSMADGSAIKKIPLEQFSDGYTFSQDLNKIAIRQSSGAIDIWNLNSSEKISSIQSDSGYCYGNTKSFSSVPIFTPNSEKIATFDCKGGVQIWSVNGSLLSESKYDNDIPSITLNDNGDINLITPPWSTGPWRGHESYLLNDFFFLDDENLGFQYYDSTVRTKRLCTISLQSASQNCEENLVLGSDNKYYKYVIKGNILQLFPFLSNTSKPPYEIEWLGLGISINKFDTQYETLIYTAQVSDYITNLKWVDLKTGEIIQKWEKRRLRASSFSDENTVAALCLDTADFGITFFNNKPKLILIDLFESESIYEENITCSGLALSHSNENRKIAISYDTLPSGSQFLKSLLLIMNFDTHDERQKIDVGCDRNISALAYSPDDSMLVVSCSYGNSDGSIYFLNAIDGTEIQHIEGYSGINSLAFSPDGKMLAVSFGGGIISVLAVPTIAP